MMFSNCSKRDLDSWALLGNPGWDWESLQPYFRKFEHYHPPDAGLEQAMHTEYIDPKLRGTDGTLHTSFCSSGSGWCEEAWLQTCKNAGFPEAKDPRTGSSLGAFNQLMSIDPATKTRSYSYSAFLEPALHRSNLSVLTDAKGSKLVFGGEKLDGAKASSVQFVVDGKEYTVGVKKEVIISAGSIQSPQILELSGIGSGELLTQLGIPVVVDNSNVGSNLQDHLILGGLAYVSYHQ
jgi:choline dehydrogenase